MKNIILICSLIILISFNFFACEDSTEVPVPPQISSETELTDFLNDILSQTEVPGFAISIVKGNQLSYQEAFGFADVQAEKPYTNQSIQHLASISKTFVAAATLKAIEQGYFDLETDINDILSVEIVNPKQPDASIKVKHLMTHSSCLLDVAEIYLAENYHILPGEDLSNEAAQSLVALGIEQRESRGLEDMLAEYFLPDGALYSLDNFASSAPGTSWSYSNFATGLCAYLVETASGQSFDDYVKAEVLIPLGMTQSTYDLAEVNQAQQVKSYLNKSTAFPRYGNDSYVEGNLYTTNADLGKYLLNMVQGSQGDSEKLFPGSTYQMLFQPQLSTEIVPAVFADDQAMYWYIEDGIVQHGGNSFGISTQLEFDPLTGEGFSLMTNLDASFDFSAYQKVMTMVRQGVNKYLQAN